MQFQYAEPTPSQSTISSTDAALSSETRPGISLGLALLLATAAVAAFQAAYAEPKLAFLMVLFAYCMVALAFVRSARVAFYLGLSVGLAIFVPQLWFFEGIFKGAAIALWLIAAIWIALFVLLSRWAVQHLPRTVALLAIPIFWTGIEYFRSELYYLRFSWVNIGFAFDQFPTLLRPGVYGIGFFIMLVAAVLYVLPVWPRTAASTILLFVFASTTAHPLPPNGVICSEMFNGPIVTGIQLEHPSQRQVIEALDDAIAKHPVTQVMILSEYTFVGPPPPAVCDWCRAHGKYLIVGGTTPIDPTTASYHNTAYVVGPNGEIVFQQGKSVPIQFFTDGVPAESQAVWKSPWGKIGLCVCYDLSYSRVTDELIRQGAQAIIVPTMDLESWGLHEHELHARVGPTRAAEYGVPVVRVCSSGISQIINNRAQTVWTASYPGQGQIITGGFNMHEGRLPLDRYLAPACVGLTAVVILSLPIVNRLCRRRKSN